MDEGQIRRRGASQAAAFIVAASDSLHLGRADYVCGGADDQVTIQAAIDALPDGRGKVVLMEGTFHTAKEIYVENTDNWSLVGQGKGTLITPDAKYESALSENGVSGESTITVSAVTGYRVGQRVIIVDDNSDIALPASTGNWDQWDIVSIVGNILTLSGALSQNFTTALNSKVYTAYDVIKVSNCDNILIRDIQIDANKANQAVGAKGRKSHAGINLITVADSIIENCRIKNCPNLSIRLEACTDIIISKNFLAGSLRGLCMYSVSERITVSHNHSTGHSENGLRFCNAKHTTFVGNDCYNNVSGIVVCHVTSEHNAIIGNSLHNNSGYGFAIEDGGDVSNLLISNNMIHDNDIGMLLSNVVDSTISNNQIFDNISDGVRFINADYNLFTNNIISGNNTENLNWMGVKLTSGDYNNISNNMISGILQKYGLIIQAGTGNKIIRNDVRDGVWKNISDAGTSTILQHNIGFITENSGTQTLAAGATSMDVPHGLDVTPTDGDIMVIAAGDMLATNKIRIGNYGATNFTVYADVAPGGAGTLYAFKAIVL